MFVADSSLKCHNKASSQQSFMHNWANCLDHCRYGDTKQ